MVSWVIIATPLNVANVLILFIVLIFFIWAEFFFLIWRVVDLLLQAYVKMTNQLWIGNHSFLIFFQLFTDYFQGCPSHTPFRSTTPTSSLSPARRSLYLPSTDSNPIGSLQEMCMKKNWTPPVYNVTQEEGEAHMKTFTFECKVLILLFSIIYWLVIF